MDKITKVYPNGFVANKDIVFSADKGEIHALLGENGAGKTTLMKILFGFEAPESGRILIRGQEVKISGALDAIAKGVGMVHQHFMLVPSLSVAENVVLGIEPTKKLLFDYKKAVEITRSLSEKYNFSVDPEAKVADLSVGLKQKVEILKALLRGAEILILDEPTAVLTPQETAELFIELKTLKEQGHTIIFISHKLGEVKEICDRFTVLRHGRTVGTGTVADYTEQQISRMMVGRDVVLEITKEKSTPTDVVLKVENLFYTTHEGKNVINDMSFAMRKGDILGIAGVEGNGQTELSEILTGLREYVRGDITVGGESLKGKSIRQLRELGIASISEDRMTFGCSNSASIRDNIIADRYYKKGYSKGIRLNNKEINRLVDEYIKQFAIQCDGREETISMLSGGNIQKVVVAREFTSDSNIIIADQPTRGIDVGSTEFIRNRLIELSRTKGVSVLLISADLNEVLEVSDRLLVMCGGRAAAYFEDASAVDEMELGEYMLGIKKMSEAALRGAMCES